MASVDRLDAFQRRHTWIGFPVAVLFKFVDDQGSILVSLITYYGFLSLFPLLLLLVTTLGFLLQDNPHLQQQIVNSALRQFPIIGTQLGRDIHSLQGSISALVIGIFGLLYGVLGIGQAAQYALNSAWAVPRNERPDPLRARVRSALLVIVFGVGILATTIITALGSSAASYGARLAWGVQVILLVVSTGTDLVLFIAAFRVLTGKEVPRRDLLPGAVVAAVAWQILQAGGALYVGRTLERTTDVYGLFGIVLGLLAWIYLEAFILVFSAEINVVRACRLWPRSLRSPFTDNVMLTRADKEAYTSYAQMSRQKSFEKIQVTFRPPDVAPEEGHKGPDESPEDPDGSRGSGSG